MGFDLSTEYLGLKLRNPVMPGASPLADTIDLVKAYEEAGASAIVMHSLFEEQITREFEATENAMDATSGSFVEATSYFPARDLFPLGPETYLEQVTRIKKAVKVPVIASLNGTTPGGWLDFARGMQDAGADALELNVYDLGANTTESSADAEARMLEMVTRMRRAIKVPFAVKLSPFYTSLAHFVRRLAEAGANGVVVFNRFYQPDIDVESLEVAPTLRLSESSELLLRLRWLAILFGRTRASLAVSGGVHTPIDVVKSVMAGASAVQMVSSLLVKGPAHLKAVLQGVTSWFQEHEYKSLEQARGSMSLERCPDPKQVERSNYAFMLQSWRSQGAGKG